MLMQEHKHVSEQIIDAYVSLYKWLLHCEMAKWALQSFMLSHIGQVFKLF